MAPREPALRPPRHDAGRRDVAGERQQGLGRARLGTWIAPGLPEAIVGEHAREVGQSGLDQAELEGAAARTRLEDDVGRAGTAHDGVHACAANVDDLARRWVLLAEVASVHADLRSEWDDNSFYVARRAMGRPPGGRRGGTQGVHGKMSTKLDITTYSLPAILADARVSSGLPSLSRSSCRPLWKTLRLEVNAQPFATHPKLTGYGDAKRLPAAY